MHTGVVLGLVTVCKYAPLGLVIGSFHRRQPVKLVSVYTTCSAQVVKVSSQLYRLRT